MQMHNELINTGRSGRVEDGLRLRLIFREIDDDGQSYVVGECLDLPGCVSQGDSMQEAESSLREAIRECISVILEDYVRTMSQNAHTDLRGITRQEELTLDLPSQLQFA